MKRVFRRVQETSGTLYISIPSEIAKKFNAEKGDSLCIEFEENKMIVAPLPISTPARVPANTPTERYQHGKE